MTAWSADFLPTDGQLFGRTMGEALARMVRDRWPRDTAKQVARAWDLEPVTAANLIKGHASERTITKALKAEGWDLLEAIGYALTGQTHHEWEERRLAAIVAEAERAKAGIRSLRARREELAQRASALDPDRVRQTWGGDARSRAGDAGQAPEAVGADATRKRGRR